MHIIKTLRFLAATIFLLLCNPLSAESVDQYDLYPFSVNEDQLSSASNFHSLNAPLSDRDRIFVCGAHFCKVGKDLQPNTVDDERVRFFGVNLTQMANFPFPSDAQRIAKRLRRLGINIVRLHYLDRSLADHQDDVKGVLFKDKFPTFNNVATTRLKKFIQVLSQEGIYVNLNLHVVYTYRSGIDQNISSPSPEHSKPALHFVPAMITGSKQYAKGIIEELGLINNPALAMVEISNESSLVYSWMLGTRNKEKWALDRVLGKEYWNLLSRIWADSGQTSAPPVFASDNSAAKQFLKLLIDLDQKYFEVLRNTIHETAGELVPVTGSQMLYGGLAELESQRNMDYLDNHFYFDFYKASSDASLRQNWQIENSQLISEIGLKSLANLAFFRDPQKPYTISEYNIPWPNTHGTQLIPTLGIIASLQDWDALIFYQYKDTTDWDDGSVNWFSLNGNASFQVNFGQFSQLFRLFKIEAATSKINVCLTAEQRHSALLKAINPWLLSDYLDKFFGFSQLLPWNHRVTVSASCATSSAINQSDLSRPSLSITSDRSLISFDSDYFVGFYGQLKPGQKLKSSFWEVRNPLKRVQEISITITCSDFFIPISKCKRLFLTAPGATFGSGTDSQKEKPILLKKYPGAGNGLTFLSNEITPKILPPKALSPLFQTAQALEFRLASLELKGILSPLDGSGSPITKIETAKSGNGIEFSINSTSIKSPWYQLVLN